ncbi:LMBR1 domain-containing protein 2 [Tetrabaena socialis]|uniref:LMBR1 domain-containing protein 2 n=1 Tax=Tetrabaena socialis TaxID=47790 RepID=A0A2J7ZWR3_9CHLO|nr:LMBR1 domain-containing protein 2 [Tetrabaena socialis]|eukprot:PNH04704.1 LMBR1 domain-containing protein 2 [Tetrabaena socialis]
MWAFFIFLVVFICGAILMLLRRYCANSVVLSVKLTTAYAWLTSMAVVAIVPLDVFSTLDNKKPHELGVLSTQVLTWLLLPFFQYYSDAGDFTVKGKCLTSLKENAILYGSVAAVGLVGVAALLISKKMTLEGLMGLGIGMSNAFGLIASIILLGYGLVEIPRNMWKADPERQLKWCAHRAGKYAEKVMKSTAELETVVTIIAANERQMRRHDPLRKYMDIIVAHVEKESPIKPSDLQAASGSRNAAGGRGGAGLDIESMNAEDLEYNYDVAGLAALRRRMFFAISSYNGDRAMYEEVMVEAFELEDVVKCRQLNDFTPRQPTRSPIKKAVWYYKCALRAHWHRAAPRPPPPVLRRGGRGVGGWRWLGRERGATTVFEDKMGSMDVPRFLRQHLNTYLPLILVVECVITALNLWDKIMGMVGRGGVL